MLELRGVTAGYGREAAVVRDVDLSVRRGEILTLAGPNGCGKTTLLRTIARQLPLLGGEIALLGRPLSGYGREELARTVSFMPQVREIPSITVRSLVAHGRFPHLGLSRRLRPADREAVERAMEETDVARWAERDLRSLSGGERQRVYLAMALAQDTELLLLDEPTTYLDMGCQFALLELVRAVNRRGKTVVMVLHDLAHALRYSRRIALLEGGRLVCCAAPEELLARGDIDRVFGVRTCRMGEGVCFLPAEDAKFSNSGEGTPCV